MKLLTVAVPSYNVERTLAATLDSLCVPEALGALDIIVVNDGSADRTAEIAERYAARYPDSVRVVTKQNGGHGSAVNAALDRAEGEYFRVVDGDDRLWKEGLLRLLDCLGQAGCDLIAAHYEKVPENPALPTQPMRFAGVPFGKKIPFEEVPGGVYFGIHSSVFRTSIFREHGLRLQEHTFYVDTEFCLLPIPFVKTVFFLDEVVYRYTVGEAGQSISPESFVRRYDDHLRVVSRMIAYAEEAGCAGRARGYLTETLARLCFTQYMLGAFYDGDRKRGAERAASFDAWLKTASPELYKRLGGSFTVRVLRALRFRFLPGAKAKNLARRTTAFFKKLTRRRRFTY